MAEHSVVLQLSHNSRLPTVALASALPPVAVQFDEKHTSWNFDVRKGPIHIEWFKGGLTNICYNALDRWGAMQCLSRSTLGLWDFPRLGCGIFPDLSHHCQAKCEHASATTSPGTLPFAAFRTRCVCCKPGLGKRCKPQ